MLIMNLGPFASHITTMSRTDVDTCSQILAYELDPSHALGAHIFLEKGMILLLCFAYCLIDHVIFGLYAGIWCPAGQNLRGPNPRVVRLVVYSDRVIYD